MTQKDDKQVAASRLIAIREGREKMLPYMKLTMPSPESPADVEMSRFVETPQARILCKLIENMRAARKAGKRKRYAVSIGPQHGKSHVLSRAGPAWLSGADPYCNVMLGTYNQTFAEEFGVDVRTLMESGAHHLVFPDHKLKKQAADHLITTKGGKLSFVGVGGSGSGKPADFFFVDDPIRNDEDAQSDSYREKVWKWFTSVVFARLLNSSSVLVVHTRWNQDDLIGRLCDPDHPERNRKYSGIAEDWEYINLPAVVQDPDLAEALGLKMEEPTDAKIIAQFGPKPMSALWPDRKSLDFLAEAKRMDSRVFGALYMGNPTPEDGDYFKREHMLEYNADELPKELNRYGASDHAVGMKQQNDSTVLGCVGIDRNDDIWVLPDLEWGRMLTDQTVEMMIALMKRHKPFMWWMESELISKSFGPFLQKRMHEEKCYTYVDPVSVAKNDKMMRGRAIQGRMQGRKVHFPRFAPWWAEAKAQMLKFPYGAHDDFVDFMAHIGMGLTKELRASDLQRIDKKVYRTGSPQWVIASSKERFARDQRLISNGGW